MADGAAHYQSEVLRVLAARYAAGATFAELRATIEPYRRVDHYRATDRAIQALRKQGKIRKSGSFRRGAPGWIKCGS